jgi:hypothetical protein
METTTYEDILRGSQACNYSTSESLEFDKIFDTTHSQFILPSWSVDVHILGYSDHLGR